MTYPFFWLLGIRTDRVADLLDMLSGEEPKAKKGTEDLPRAPKRGADENPRFYATLLAQEDNLFTNRGNLFLVAHAMLLGGFFALLSTDRCLDNTIKWSLIGLAAIGGLLAFFWLRLGMNHVKYLGHIKQRLEHYDPRHLALRDAPGRGRRVFSAGRVIGSFIPIFLLLAWIAALILALGLLGSPNWASWPSLP